MQKNKKETDEKFTDNVNEWTTIHQNSGLLLSCDGHQVFIEFGLCNGLSALSLHFFMLLRNNV